MVRKIIRSGDSRLGKKSKPVGKVDKKVLALIKDLTDTLKAQKDPEGVGLAACQIGVNLRVFVMLDKDQIRPIINPEIVSLEKGKPTTKSHKEILEGCLSLPNYYSPLVRAGKIIIKHLGLDNQVKTEDFSGMSAQIVQHEIDHLNGIMFVERLLEQKQTLYKFDKGQFEEVELI